MTTKLASILDLQALNDQVQVGNIRVQYHPTLPLRIYNYTEKCAWDKAWTHESMMCRGLVADDDNIVRARCYGKFWNIFEHESDLLPPIPWGEPYEVYDKVDGSYGQGVPTADGWIVATRGSFASDQAIHATKILRERYSAFTVGLSGMITPIWEIVYPANRIVVNHGDMDDLVLLGGVVVENGRSISPHHLAIMLGWDGPVVEKYPVRTVEELAADNTHNREGYVLWFPKSDFRVKVKFEEYLTLHRVLTHANSRTVWEALRTGADLPAIEGVPEFDAWLDDQRQELVAAFYSLSSRATFALRAARRRSTRREQAEYLLTSYDKTVAGIVFRMLDGKNYDDVIWKAIKPEYSLPFWSEDSENTAKVA